jgi:hypothetical protein
MPSDRSTLQRGVPGSDHSAWQEPTAPAGRRLPSAPRERKPALAALAVLLILGCALGTGFLVIQSGKRVAAIEVNEEIGQGQKIPLSAMTEVQIASNSGLSYVPWNQAEQVSRFYAGSAIPAGTLLTNSMVTVSAASTAGRDVLGLPLKDGEFPRGLQVGDHVDIYQVSDSTDSCPGRSGTTLAANAIVLSMTAPGVGSGSSSQLDVEVALAPADAGQVACNAANAIVGLAVLPNDGRGAAGAVPGGVVAATGWPLASLTTGVVTTASGGISARWAERPMWPRLRPRLMKTSPVTARPAHQ